MLKNLLVLAIFASAFISCEAESIEESTFSRETEETETDNAEDEIEDNDDTDLDIVDVFIDSGKGLNN